MLNHLLISTRSSTTNTDWIERIVEETIYSGIPCHKDRPSGRFGETNLSVNTQLDSWNVIVEWDKTNIKVWDIISITDPDLWKVGDYQLQVQPKANRLANWKIDSIQFNVYAI